MRFYLSLLVGLIGVACLGAKATILPPEPFEEIKRKADLIGLVKVEQVEATGTGLVKATVVERFKGEPASGAITIAWPQTLHPDQGEKYYLSPKVGEVFYAFLKKSETGLFSNASAQWSFYRVKEAQSEKEIRGNRIYHQDCYWEFDGDSARRFRYARQPNVVKWPVDHVVGSGDSLWKLAERYYGDPSRWRRIWERNPWITDPAKLNVSAKITIPSVSDYE